MVIFHSYVSLTEGNLNLFSEQSGIIPWDFPNAEMHFHELGRLSSRRTRTLVGVGRQFVGITLVGAPER